MQTSILCQQIKRTATLYKPYFLSPSCLLTYSNLYQALKTFLIFDLPEVMISSAIPTE